MQQLLFFFKGQKLLFLTNPLNLVLRATPSKDAVYIINLCSFKNHQKYIISYVQFRYCDYLRLSYQYLTQSQDTKNFKTSSTANLQFIYYKLQNHRFYSSFLILFLFSFSCVVHVYGHMCICGYTQIYMVCVHVEAQGWCQESTSIALLPYSTRQGL